MSVIQFAVLVLVVAPVYLMTTICVLATNASEASYDWRPVGERVRSARLALLAPIWPITGIYFVALWFVRLVRLAVKGESS